MAGDCTCFTVHVHFAISSPLCLHEQRGLLWNATFHFTIDIAKLEAIYLSNVQNACSAHLG